MDKQIKIDGDSHKDLEALATAHGRTMKEFTEQMIFYFKKTGQDPLEVNVESTAAAIKALDKRIISFIRKQETDLLQPLVDNIKVIAEQVVNFLSGHAKDEDLKKLENTQNTQSTELSTMRMEMQQLRGIIDEMKQQQKNTQQLLEERLPEKKPGGWNPFKT